MTTRPVTHCAHAETTTLLWLYGEGPEEHVHHMADCAVCQEVAETHAAVASAVGPVREALQADPAADPPPSALGEVDATPEPANRRLDPSLLVGVAVGLAVAAVVLVGLVLTLDGGAPEAPSIAENPVEAPAPAPDLAPDDAEERVVAQDDPPRQVAPFEDVDAELLIEPGDTGLDPASPSSDERLAELLAEDPFAGLDDELGDLEAAFDALEADLTTL